jgi:hypothetical protein
VGGHHVTLDLPTSVTPAELHWACVRSGAITILDVFDSLPWFRSGADWTAWRAFLCAVYGLPMTEQEYAIFRACTGRKDPPRGKVAEAWVPVGRRGRKSAIAATIGVWEGAFHEHDSYTAPGEVARIPIISKDKDDAGAIRGFAAAILSGPELSWLLAKKITGEDIQLVNRCELKIRAATLTAGRSRSIPAALYDEMAFWPKDESATPDEDIIRGVSPGMANVPHALTVGLSSPYARRGVFYQKYKDHYAQESDRILVWNADTRTMHDTPAIREYVEQAWEDDPVAAKAEVGENGHVEFRSDVETYVREEVVAACTEKGVSERPPDLKHNPRRYWGFIDPSGGSSDSFTLGISHNEDGRPTLDFLEEWRAPFDPSIATREAVEHLQRYGVKVVKGDHWGGEWLRDRVRSAVPEWPVQYVVSEKTKSRIYLDVMPRLNAADVALLDIKRLRSQLTDLERREGAGGRDYVDHPPGGHDDLANAACGALLEADIGARRKHPEKPVPPPTTTQEILSRARWDTLREERATAGGRPDLTRRQQIYRRRRA